MSAKRKASGLPAPSSKTPPDEIKLRYVMMNAGNHLITADGYPDFFVSTAIKEQAFAMIEDLLSSFMSARLDCHLCYAIDVTASQINMVRRTFLARRGFLRRRP